MKVDVIYNEDPLKHYMWLDRKFKRNFRGVAEEKEKGFEEAPVE